MKRIIITLAIVATLASPARASKMTVAEGHWAWNEGPLAERDHVASWLMGYFDGITMVCTFAWGDPAPNNGAVISSFMAHVGQITTTFPDVPLKDALGSWLVQRGFWTRTSCPGVKP